jgi:hypothetical protein
MDQTQKKIKNTKNIYNKLNHITLKSYQLWTNQGYGHVGNQARINNLASIYFDYHSKITILSK